MDLDRELAAAVADKKKAEKTLFLATMRIHDLNNEIHLRDYGYCEGSIVRVQISTGLGRRETIKEHRAIVSNLDTMRDRVWRVEVRLATKSGAWSKNTRSIYPDAKRRNYSDKILEVIEPKPGGGLVSEEASDGP